MFPEMGLIIYKQSEFCRPNLIAYWSKLPFKVITDGKVVPWLN